MSVLLIKLTLVPVVMAVVTQIGRKWGSSIGGILASMPWIAGPILLFFVLEQGTSFAIRSVPGILTGVVSLVSFSLLYARLSRRLGGLVSLLLAYGGYVLVALPFSIGTLNLYVSYGLALVSIALALRFFPRPVGPSAPPKRLTYDLPIRMVAATLFVLAITEIAGIAGPLWSGILTPFPVITSILAVFTHYLQGSNTAIVTLRGTVLGLFGFTTFLFLQALLLPRFSVGTSFLLALLVNLAISYATIRLSRANK